MSIPSSSVLYQNADNTVTLIDVPHSIAAAQGTIQSPCISTLRSCAPIQEPYVYKGPKTSSKKAKLEANSGDAELHQEYARLLVQALKDVSQHMEGDWRHPRSFIEANAPKRSKKRKRNAGRTPIEIIEATSSGDESTATASVVDAFQTPATTTELPENILPHLAGRRRYCSESYDIRVHSAPEAGESRVIKLDYKDRFTTNATSRPTLLSVEVPEGHETQSFAFHIPPRSSFHLGDCSKAYDFHKAIRDQARIHQTRKEFDMITLDPPWPNRSVKRGSSYATTDDLGDMRELLLGLELPALMSKECMIGMWITNKPAIRELVLGKEGVFACWDVELVEEWVWLKVTAKGEPVLPLDAAWRKPYEVLLLGRRRHRTAPITPIARTNTEGSVDGAERPEEESVEVKRRALISVPDLHSRKPCLKAFLYSFRGLADDARVLEVFARNLVAGWWSWGNECIKFNWEGYWQGDEEETASAEKAKAAIDEAREKEHTFWTGKTRGDGNSERL